ncbi:MAG: phage tail tape measure protein, partial [candidate division NC10 bacterium]
MALAIDGSVDSLGRFGVQFDANATQQERFQVIMAKGLTLFGTAEAQAATFEGRLAQFKNAVNDLAETIGNVLLPGLTDLVKQLANATRGADDFAKAHPKLTAAMVQLAGGIGLVALALAPILTFWPHLVKAFQALTIIILPLLADLAVLAAEVLALTAAIVALWFAFVNFDDVLTLVADALTSAFLSAINFVITAVERLLELLAKLPLIGGGFEFLANKVDQLRQTVDGLANDSLDNLKNSLSNVGEDAKAFFQPLTESLQGMGLFGGGATTGAADGGGAGASGGGGGMP